MKCKLDRAKLRTHVAASDLVGELLASTLVHLSLLRLTRAFMGMDMWPGDIKAGRYAMTADLYVEVIKLLLLLCSEVI